MGMEGSLVNRLMENGRTEPEVGMGCTFFSWSDRSSGTVVEVIPFKSGPKAGKARIAMVRPDNVEVISGSEQDGSARYKITPAEDGQAVLVKRMPDRKHKDPKTGEEIVSPGGWRAGGAHGTKVSFGFRDHYHDPHF